MTPARLCTRCNVNPQPEGKRTWCNPCNAASIRAARLGRVVPPGVCKCGGRLPAGWHLCRVCAVVAGRKGGHPQRRRVDVRDDRPRCQAVGCDLPVRGEARGCALHWPTFLRDTPPLEHYATARNEVEW